MILEEVQGLRGEGIGGGCEVVCREGGWFGRSGCRREQPSTVGLVRRRWCREDVVLLTDGNGAVVAFAWGGENSCAWCLPRCFVGIEGGCEVFVGRGRPVECVVHGRLGHLGLLFRRRCSRAEDWWRRLGSRVRGWWLHDWLLLSRCLRWRDGL